ncbi:VPS10 domain-containing protein [Zobellia sp. 1_MG-2023]|uniref:VPS10 domain-containing protein n=1 Tax=Zobellia sp. 1_MG-2023 TaxID=3062626 RepID=UPI0026E2C864|nr:BACON domain-containing carbohydrate-binding protein [Zobellia sp. 1_MG-2023]MDO6820194.1 BACON domain-containing carbohydrate-binding protein [Zobellia sp. 1_MG-2023]
MKHVFLLISFLFLSGLNAQIVTKKQNKTYKHIIETSKTKSFQSLVNEIDSYYSTPLKQERKDFKKYMRWRTFAENRLDANGEIANVGQLNYEAALEQNIKLKKANKLALKSAKNGDVLQWENVIHEAPKERGRVDCVAVDPSNPDIIYAGANTGGVWKTIDGGLNWIPLTDNLPTLGTTSIVIDPNSPVNSRKIYVLVGDGGWGNQYHSTGLYVSNDSGVTWSPMSLQFDETVNWPSARKLVMDPMNSEILYAVFWTSIYKTLDGGNTWTKLAISNTQNYGFFDMEICPDNSDTLYVVERDQIFHRSIDGGNTWITSTMPGDTVTSGAQTGIAVTPANPNVVYYLSMEPYGTDNSKFHGIYKSTDKGQTFSLFEDDMPDPWFLIQKYGMAEIAVSPTNENDIFTGSYFTHRYNSSTGNLEAIDSQNAHVDVRGLYFIDGRLFSCNDGGLDMTTDFENWEDLSSGMLIKQIYEVDTDNNDSKKILLGTQDNGFSYVNNGSEDVLAIGDVYYVAASKLFDRVYFNINYRNIGGANTNPNELKKIEPKNVGSGPMLVYDSYSQDGLDTDVLLVADGNDIKRIFIDQDFNFNWQNLSNGQFSDGNIRWVGFDVSETNKNSFYGVSANGNNWNLIVKSDNLLDTQPIFTDISDTFPEIENKLTSVVMSDNQTEKVWLACGGYSASEKTFYSNDGGQNWVNMSKGLPNTPVNTLAYQKLEDADVIYAGTDIGVYYFINDLSRTWQPYCLETLPTTIINSLKYNSNDGLLTAGTFGRGVWQIEALSEVPNSLDISPETQNVGVTSGTITYSVSSNVDWNVSESSDWLEAVKTNDTTLTVTYDENIITENRTATISISGGELTNEILVIQNGITPSLVVSPETLTVTTDAGSETYSVASNVDWDVSESADWLTVVKTNENTFTVNYDENISQEMRMATINITADTISRIISIEQNFVEDDFFNESEITIHPNPTSSKFYIKSNKNITSEFDVNIYDLTGKKVVSIKANELLSDEPLEVNISRLQAGLYVVKLNNIEIETLKKVLKK